jgi:tyrosyl-tRNA synthetase
MADPIPIPPGPEQLAVLERGTVDLHPKDELRARLSESHRTQTPLVIKTGFDPTAPDLHLGHTVLIEKMAQFQRLGHDVVFLVGDYTARIGDPTGRNAMRPPLSEAEIAENAKTYTDQVFKILDRERTRVEWNSRWLDGLKFEDIIVLASKYNVGRMLERRDFRQRFDANKQIAIHEFLYPLMQAYDSVALKADVELGGHDQVFNLNAGRHVMEQYGLKAQCVLTVGLLLGLDGQEKMSKSKGNHIGITEAPRDMFGKVMSISDEQMRDWYILLLSETSELIESDPNRAKKNLAAAMVTRFYDATTADEVLAWWEAGRPADAETVVDTATAPLFKLVQNVGAASSGGDARRKIQQGGVRIDGTKAADPNLVVEPGEYLLQVGKKFSIRVRIA